MEIIIHLKFLMPQELVKLYNFNELRKKKMINCNIFCDKLLYFFNLLKIY